MAHNTITTPDSSSSYTEQRSAGNAIAENSDLITQILVRLPVKPLTQFKSVSKQWLSLISDSQFSLHHSRRNRKPISALFLLSLNKINPEFSFLPFADCSLGSPHFQFLAHPVCFNNGVFWNGKVHWISNSDIVCFDIDEGYLKIMPLPLTSNGSNVMYFGESSGHLHHVVNFKGSKALFNVFEMETDYSGWVLKYCCDLDTVIRPPDMLLNHKSCAFSLIFLGRGEKEDESCLVIGIHGKLISYDLKNMTSKKLIDLLPFCYKNGWAQRARYKALPYNETLFEV
ncbi:F-box protein At5g07610-like isoform X1 [Camellia sinensis]|uniref:F-box protein At5g07610-like isoform X1 n=1 Tax=Camellia sinensis TaxID=4442 RepID=UPI0010359546|nr:F-box protein At5g07610-like isoform X1 [Camellia sinensis]